MANDVQIIDNTDRHRYEAHVGDTVAGFAEYQLATDLLKALVICPFITEWIRKHRDYTDVLYGAPPSKVTD